MRGGGGGRGGRSLRRPQQGCELLALLQKCFKDLSQKLWLSLGLADISFRERLAQFDGYTFIAPINQRLQFLSQVQDKTEGCKSS